MGVDIYLYAAHLHAHALNCIQARATLTASLLTKSTYMHASILKDVCACVDVRMDAWIRQGFQDAYIHTFLIAACSSTLTDVGVGIDFNDPDVHLLVQQEVEPKDLKCIFLAVGPAFATPPGRAWSQCRGFVS